MYLLSISHWGVFIVVLPGFEHVPMTTHQEMAYMVL